MLPWSAVEVDKHRPTTSRCSKVCHVSRAWSQRRRTHRQRTRRQSLHSYDQKHSQPAQDRREDGGDWRSAYSVKTI